MRAEFRVFVLLPLLAVMLAACGNKSEEKEGKGKRPDTPVTVVQSEIRSLSDYQYSVGSVVGDANPRISAEIAGRVQQVLVQAGDQIRQGQVLLQLDDADQRLQLDAARADTRRVQEQLQQQQRTVDRLQALIRDKFVPPDQLEAALSQQAELKEQLTASRAQVALMEHNLAKTTVRSPVSGRIQERNVAPGERINPDKVLFVLVGGQGVRAHLPFPEQAAALIRAGQRVELNAPMAPAEPVQAKIAEIQPGVAATSRSFIAMADLPAGLDWMPGASVSARVITGQRVNAVVVPEVAVVLRPKGKVVYLISQNKAHERLVQTGAQQDGLVEIRAGLHAGESIASDGAAYLTDGAPVNVKSAPAEKAK